LIANPRADEQAGGERAPLGVAVLPECDGGDGGQDRQVVELAVVARDDGERRAERDERGRGDPPAVARAAAAQHLVDDGGDRGVGGDRRHPHERRVREAGEVAGAVGQPREREEPGRVGPRDPLARADPRDVRVERRVGQHAAQVVEHAHVVGLAVRGERQDEAEQRPCGEQPDEDQPRASP
jgi:hypothetical protein